MALLLSAMVLHGADNVENWFKEGSFQGNLRYYYISTSKDGGTEATTSQHANAIGGQLGYVTGSLYGLKLGTTFMTTSPFALPEGASNVEQSNLSRYNAKKPGATVESGNEGFSALGEAYVHYNRDVYEIWYGRRVINTPLMDARDVRMMPSSFEGAMATIKVTPSLEVGGGFIDKFKQRTSDQFVDVIESALGTHTRTITGRDGGYVIPLSINYHEGALSGKLYDYYAPDFMNSIYVEGNYKGVLAPMVGYSAAVQAIVQEGIGNADSTAAQALMGGKIDTRSIGAKATLNYHDTTLLMAMSHVFARQGKHDSLVLPWDGMPLFTNTLTANGLFLSDYGKGLESDTAYIGDTTGYKIGVNQKLEGIGLSGVSLGLAYAHYDGDRFLLGAQEDINAEVIYLRENFSVGLKGIWVNNNTAMGNDPHGTAKVNGDFTQYRVVANYKF